MNRQKPEDVLRGGAGRRAAVHRWVRKGSGAYDTMIVLAEQCVADYDDNSCTRGYLVRPKRH